MIDKVLNKHEYRERERHMSPGTYYELVDVVKSVTEQQIKDLDAAREKIKVQMDLAQSFSHALNDAALKFHEESIHRMRFNKRSIGSMENVQDDDGTQYDFKSHNYILLLASVANAISEFYRQAYDLFGQLVPPVVISMKKRIIDDPDDFEQFQAINYEMQMNKDAVDRYAGTILSVSLAKDAPSHFVKEINKQVEQFYKYLIHTHSKEGKKIINNVAVTNVALHIFENIDAHGEIDKDFDRERISAYTLRKAETLAQALMDENVKACIKNPDKLHYLVRVATVDLVSHFNDICSIFKPQMDKLNKYGRPGEDKGIPQSELATLDAMKFSAVVYNESISTKTEADKLGDKMRDETITNLADMLLSDDKIDFSEIVDYVINRKAELNKFYFEENSFYVCKIGEGNPFLGQAPGALYVVPAERPMGKIEDILGSGFDEIRDFHSSIESSAKFHDLFVATSPSKSADKSNVLMVGPQGCGKTEVLRAVGADSDSIGVFAQGSDFLTCWKGEAEKNPKRLFQEGLRLSKESKRHVHFLIDEIDSLLNNDKDLSGNNNLTLEFQILMDGVVSYPNLSVWGATNNVERIPMPMIRRFNKVLIVGELNSDDRVNLLKKFTSYMPIASSIKDTHWSEWSAKLDGATGDVIRKIADHIWRTKMNQFVRNNPDAAEAMVHYLNANGKFSIDEFNREDFKRALSKYISVTGEDIQKSIETNLMNIGVRAEIRVAKETYSRAKAYINSIQEEIDIASGKK